MANEIPEDASTPIPLSLETLPFVLERSSSEELPEFVIPLAREPICSEDQHMIDQLAAESEPLVDELVESMTGFYEQKGSVLIPDTWRRLMDAYGKLAELYQEHGFFQESQWVLEGIYRHIEKREGYVCVEVTNKVHDDQGWSRGEDHQKWICQNYASLYYFGRLILDRDNNAFLIASASLYIQTAIDMSGPIEDHAIAALDTN